MNRPTLKTQAELEKVIRHGSWQKQAEALYYCQKNALDTFKSFTPNAGSQPFKNLAEFAKHCGMSMRAMYNRLEVAREEERFKLILNRPDISLELARTLYQVDFESYMLLLWALRTGLAADLVAEIALGPAARKQATEAVRARLKEMVELMNEGQELLKEEK